MAGRFAFTTVLLLLALTCVQSRFLRWRPRQQQVANDGSSSSGSNSSDDSDSSEEQMAAATTVQPNPTATGTTIQPATGTTDSVTDNGMTAPGTLSINDP